MRILMVTPTFLPYMGGQEMYVGKLSEALAEHGHEVTVFTTDSTSRVPFKRVIGGRENRRNVTIIRFPCHAVGYSYFPFAPRLTHALLNRRITKQDIVHAHGFGHFTSDVVALQRHIFKVPTVLTTHGIHQESGQEGLLRSLLWFYYRDSLVRLTLRGVDKIVAISPDEIRYLARFGSDVLNKVSVIPIGVTIEEIDQRSPSTHCARPMVLYLGRIYPGKGLEFLIEALPRLTRYDPLVIFAGARTEFAKTLQELARKRNVAENVIFTGFVDEMEKKRLLREATVLCLPSKYEGASLAVLEAMAFGLPVVATRVGGVPYLVENGSSGYLVRYGDPEVLSLCLEKIIVNPALQHDMGKRGRMIAEKHSWSCLAERFEHLYTELQEIRHGQSMYSFRQVG